MPTHDIMSQKLLVCGATGFIGRNLLTHFAARREYDVTGVWHSRPPYEVENVRWVQADLRRDDDVMLVVGGQDIVLHAAATTSGSYDIVNRPYINVTDSAVMNSLLLRACYATAVRHFLFFSCGVIYPSQTSLAREEDFDPAKGPPDAYYGVGWTKVYAENMCRFFAGLGRTRHTVVRHSNIYGPWDKFDLERSHVFGATVTKVLQSANKRIVVWGSGKEGRDLLYVDDLVCFVERALERQDQAFVLCNVGSGEAVSIRSLVERIIAASGQQLEIEYDTTRPTIPTTVTLDCSRARELFGWNPTVTLEAGIARTIAWYRAQMMPSKIS